MQEKIRRRKRLTTSELYRENPDFRAYVDRTSCSYRHRITSYEALSLAFVKKVAKQYENPNNTYTFDNIGPLSHLTKGDRIRSMSDEEIAEDRVECMNRYRSPYKKWVRDFDGVCDTRDQAVAAEVE